MKWTENDGPSLFSSVGKGLTLLKLSLRNEESVSHKPAQIPILLISIIQSLRVSGIAPDLLLNWMKITLTSLSDCNFQPTKLSWAGNCLLMDLSWSLPAMYGFLGQFASFWDNFDKKKSIGLVALNSSWRHGPRCVTEARGLSQSGSFVNFYIRKVHHIENGIM